MPNETPNIAIIGAGIAGLTLATRLQAAGLSVVVFDKGRGVAGRMATRWADAEKRDHGPTFDHGAQYFTARDPAFQQSVADWQEAGVVAEWRATIGTLRGGEFTVDHRNHPRYVGTPGNNALCRRLAAGLDVRSGVAVATAERTADGWRLFGAEEQLLGEFDWFVTTAPAPQSAELLGAAPALAAQAAAARMTGCWAVMVAFELPLELPYGGAFVEPIRPGNGPLSWIANDSSKPGRPIVEHSGSPTERWVLHGSPDWSEANLELDPPAATEKLLAAFWQATGASPRETIYQRAHRWRHALPPAPLDTPCLCDADLRAGACGDWCGGPRVEGAFLSGAALADRLLATL